MLEVQLAALHSSLPSFSLLHAPPWPGLHQHHQGAAFHRPFQMLPSPLHLSTVIGVRCGSPWAQLSQGPSGAGVPRGARVLHTRLRSEDAAHFPFICLCTVPLQPLLSLCCIQRDSSASANYLAKVFLGEIISHKHLLSSLLYVPRGTGALDINHLVPSPSTHLSQRTL